MLYSHCFWYPSTKTFRGLKVITWATANFFLCVYLSVSVCAYAIALVWMSENKLRHCFEARPLLCCLLLLMSGQLAHELLGSLLTPSPISPQEHRDYRHMLCYLDLDRFQGLELRSSHLLVKCFTDGAISPAQHLTLACALVQLSPAFLGLYSMLEYKGKAAELCSPSHPEVPGVQCLSWQWGESLMFSLRSRVSSLAGRAQHVGLPFLRYL